ncbi:MAG TPA: phosphatidate cytidylyltransferase, partial [Candidatus Eisenbacteria bacterium]|nr:phosphatidate cytidylyltransferase [Candidatus Eisenbacteria bacterium]
MSVSAERPRALREQALPARVASGVGLAVLTLFAVWRGGAIFAAVLSFTLLCGVAEFVRMARRAGYPVFVPQTFVLAAAILFYAQMPVIPGASVVIPLIVLWFLVELLRFPDLGRTAGLAFTCLGLLYVLGLGLHLQWLRDDAQGGARILAVLLGTWAADTAAFFVGIRWGRHRLAPSISPGKSTEGAVAGGIAALL